MDTRNFPDDINLADLQRFQILVSGIRDYAIYMLDINGNVTSWNAGAQRFKGYTEAEILGHHFSRFHTPEDQKADLPAKALHTAETEGKFQTEGWRVRKDGTQFWASVVIDPIRASDGRLLGFAKITQDITDRKKAAETLRQSEQQFRLLVQGVTDYAIYMLDPSGNISNWNAGAEHIKGYTQDEVIGTHFSRFYVEEDRAAGLPAIALHTALTQGRFEKEGWRLRKDGTAFMAHVVIDPIRNEIGDLVGYAKITRDITEKQSALAALKRTEHALHQAQKMETIGKLTGGVAHDFNNLLQIIAGNLHLLANDVSGNPRAERRLESALSAVGRGAKLSSYLLAFGRRQALDPKVVSIGRLLFSMEDMLRRSIGESVQIETVISGGLWNTCVDVAQFENALVNLAINARDAMDGSGRLTIEAGNAVLDNDYAQRNIEVNAGQYVLIAVTDTGCGMAPEVLAQAFEPFYSTKAEGKGSGLGLSMVYGFVKQSGGHVQIYSEAGEGTTIKLYLPRSMETEEVIAAPVVEDIVGGTETILVAEDDQQVCATVVEMLSELGYRVLKVNDAAGALTIIESGVKIDLLFTDVVMPGPMRSPDMARRARERLPDLAVLFTSGYTQNAIVHGGRLDPGVELLSKPYTREALARRVRHVLANQVQRKHGIVEQRASQPLVKESLNGLRILYVEDDDLIRETTAELLEHSGHFVGPAWSGVEAMRLLNTGSYDVLLTDIGLAVMSGTALAAQVRATHPDIGIVFATGDTSATSDLTGSVMLAKPYTSSDLADVLHRFRKR